MKRSTLTAGAIAAVAPAQNVLDAPMSVDAEGRLSRKVDPDPPLYVWVDGKTGKPYTDNKWREPKETVLESNEEFIARTWNSNAQTKKLWTKLNAGAVEQTMKLPDAAQRIHYKWEPEQIDEKTWTWHLVRNQLRASPRTRRLLPSHARATRTPRAHVQPTRTIQPSGTPTGSTNGADCATSTRRSG